MEEIFFPPGGEMEFEMQIFTLGLPQNQGTIKQIYHTPSTYIFTCTCAIQMHNCQRESQINKANAFAAK